MNEKMERCTMPTEGKHVFCEDVSNPQINLHIQFNHNKNLMMFCIKKLS